MRQRRTPSRRLILGSDFFADMSLIRTQLDDVSIGSDDAGTFGEPLLHVVVHLEFAEQKKLRVIAGLGGIERRAQGLTWACGPDQPGGDDDDEIGFLLL